MSSSADEITEPQMTMRLDAMKKRHNLFHRSTTRCFTRCTRLTGGSPCSTGSRWWAGTVRAGPSLSHCTIKLPPPRHMASGNDAATGRGSERGNPCAWRACCVWSWRVRRAAGRRPPFAQSGTRSRASLLQFIILKQEGRGGGSK